MTKRDSSLTLCMITHMQYLKKKKIKTCNRVIKIKYRFNFKLYMFICYSFHENKFDIVVILFVCCKSNCREYFSKQTSLLVSSIYETTHKH